MQEGVMESEEPGQESLDKSKYDVTTDMHGTTTYWLNGKRHRDDDQPAVIKADGSEYWYRNGKIHRDNKQPAVIKADGTKYWYTDGNYIGSLIPMQEGVMESAAPGQEAWVKKNKQNFINQYGQKKGLEVLYATSWDRSKKNEDVNEDVSMNITAQGEDDVVSIIRKLSGLDNSTVAPDMQPVVAVNEPVAPQFSTMSDLVSTLDQIDASPGDDDGENEIEVIPAAEFDTEPEVEESEYANEPDPTVHTSTTAMINQGNDLNRPKRSYSDRPYRGDNPMAETRDLLKQYASMRKDISK